MTNQNLLAECLQFEDKNNFPCKKNQRPFTCFHPLLPVHHCLGSGLVLWKPSSSITSQLPSAGPTLSKHIFLAPATLRNHSINDWRAHRDTSRRTASGHASSSKVCENYVPSAPSLSVNYRKSAVETWFVHDLSMICLICLATREVT